MAILSSLQGIEVTICVDDDALHECACDNDEIEHEEEEVIGHQEKCTVTNYIESNTGKEFMIQLKIEAPYRLNCAALQFETEVDGKSIDRSLVMRDTYDGKSWEEEILGPVTTRGKQVVVSPLKFAGIKTSTYATRRLDDHSKPSQRPRKSKTPSSASRRSCSAESARSLSQSPGGAYRNNLRIRRSCIGRWIGSLLNTTRRIIRRRW